jgi:hypothetical protein
MEPEVMYFEKEIYQKRQYAACSVAISKTDMPQLAFGGFGSLRGGY